MREYRNIDLVGSEKKAKKLASQPTFQSYTIFHEHLIAVERYQSSVKMDKPIYTGISVFELSKLLMYEFHYDYIKEKYSGEKSKLCFTDTDSLLYQIETDDLYGDMLENHERFDFSEYPDDHPCFTGRDQESVSLIKMENKKVIGKMKNELKGNLLLEFVGVKSKAYSYEYKNRVFLDADGKEVEEELGISKFVISECKKLKGIHKYVVKRGINHKDYKETIYEGKRLHVNMRTFRSFGHQIKTISQNKLALSNYDDKRLILDDGISTLAHGHYRTL